MAKYALITEIQKEASEAEWWMDQTEKDESLQIFVSFEEAKAEMKKAVRRLTESCGFFPSKGGKYEPIEEYVDISEEGDDDIEKLGKIISNTINKPDYCCEEEGLDIHDTDDGDWYFAFVGNKDFILADYYGKTLKMNIHNMTDAEKTYYFCYSESDDYGRTVNSITVRLYNDAK